MNTTAFHWPPEGKFGSGGCAKDRHCTSHTMRSSSCSLLGVASCPVHNQSMAYSQRRSSGV
eukprot:6249225-Prymnesium_polylepis.1